MTTRRELLSGVALPVDLARAQLSIAVASWFYVLLPHTLDECLAMPLDFVVRHAALRGTVGLRKTDLVLSGMRTVLAKRRDAGLSARAMFLVPNHELGRGVVRRMAKHGLRAAVFRGREAKHPDAKHLPPERKHMCWNLKPVREVLSVGGDVTDAVCRHCPFREECPYWAQLDECAGAEVVVASHDFLFHALPEQICKDSAFVVVDESWWSRGLEVPKVDPSTKRISHSLPVGGFAQHVLDHSHTLTEAERLELWSASQKLERAMSIAQTGTRRANGMPLGRICLDEFGLTLAECEAAAELEAKRRADVPLSIKLPLPEWYAALRIAGVNAEIWRRQQVWRHLAQMLRDNSWRCAKVAVALNPQGHRIVKLFGRKQVRSKIWQLPILMIDATLKMEIIRAFLARAELIGDIVALEPHCKRTIVRAPKGAGNRPDAIWHLDLLSDKLLQRVETSALLHDAGIGTREETKRRLTRIPDERKLHYNATVGLNLEAFMRAPVLFALDRSQAAPGDLADEVRALFGEAVEWLDPNYCPQSFRTTDGMEHVIRAPLWLRGETGLPCAAAQVIYEASTVAECMIQYPGRGRPLDRTADNPERPPLHIFYLVNDVVPPVPIDRVMSWEEFAPPILLEMIAAGLVILSPSDALAVFPELFGEGVTRQAVSQAMDRALGGADFRNTAVYRFFIREGCGNGGWWRVRYRPHGKGQQVRTAYARDPNAARRRIEDAIGPLAMWRVEPAG